jgi:hypothetical protein
MCFLSSYHLYKNKAITHQQGFEVLNLTGASMAKNNDLKKVLKQLDAVNPANLSIDKLQEMLKAIAEQLEQLTERARKSEQMVIDLLERSDPDALRKARNEAGKLRAQNESLEDLQAKLNKNIQRRQLRENMAKAIGSVRLLNCLETFILTLIVFVLGLLVYDFSGPADELRPSWLTGNNIFLIDLVCCAIFMSEFIFRLRCADSKKYVWRNHWIDFVTSIPIPGEAQLARFGRAARLGRFARLLRLLRFLRFLRLFFMLWRGMDKLQDVIDVKMMKRTIRWAAVVTLLGAIVMYKLEGAMIVENGIESPNPVGNLLLAVWWSFTTVATGGFGDIHNPISINGQILTAILVITGMVLIGVFTATLTSLFVGEQSEEIERLQDDLSMKIDAIAERLDKLDPD